jgi:hypothetical protein
MQVRSSLVTSVAACLFSTMLFAQGRGGPVYQSPQLEADGRATFRVFAPQAMAVTVNGEIAGGMVAAPGAPPPPADGRGGGPPPVTLTKGADGVWSGTTVRPMRPGPGGNARSRSTV